MIRAGERKGRTIGLKNIAHSITTRQGKQHGRRNKKAYRVNIVVINVLYDDVYMYSLYK